jgi:hypothetical protein
MEDDNCWACTALARLLRLCTERAARDMEAQAGQLLQAAREMRGEA